MKKKERGERYGVFLCCRTALLQRVKTLSIKACFGLDIEEERRGGWRGSKSFQPVVLTKNLCKGKKRQTGPGRKRKGKK